MAFNPQTGLVYIPAQTIPLFMGNDAAYTYNDPSKSMAMAAGIRVLHPSAVSRRFQLLVAFWLGILPLKKPLGKLNMWPHGTVAY